MEVHNHFEDTNFIDTVQIKCSTDLVPLLNDALETLKQQLVSECQRVQEIREEKKKYVAAYNRYVSLQKELHERAAQIDELAGMLGPVDAVKAMQEDDSDAIGSTVEVHTSIKQLRDALPLWKAVRWYVGYAGEARISDVLLFLHAMGITAANRSAIESALRMHPEAFKVRKKANEKYIALKGA